MIYLPITKKTKSLFDIDKHRYLSSYMSIHDREKVDPKVLCYFSRYEYHRDIHRKLTDYFVFHFCGADSL